MAAKKKKKKGEVARRSDSSVMSKDQMEKYKGMGGAGMEKATQSDFRIPMVYVAQSNSAAIDDGSDRFIKGLKVGDLYDTVNRRILPDNVRVIPCHFDVKAIEWVPIDEGGGFIGVHPRSRLHDADVGFSDKGKPMINEHFLVETAEWVMLAEVEEGKWAQFMIPMSSSNLRASGTLCTMIAEWRPSWWEGSDIPPSFLNTYRLGTERLVKDSNSYHAMTVVVDAETPPEVLARAESLCKLATENVLQAEGREQDTSPDTSPQAGSDSVL